MKLLHLLKETSLAVADNLFYFISFFVKKDGRLWAFGSVFGSQYADNSKYLFEYVAEEHPEIRAVWFSGNPAVVSSLRNDGYEAYRFYEPRGIWTALRARVGFISHSYVRDIRPFVFTSATVLVNLWHGIPLKRIALDDNVSEVRNSKLFLPFKKLPYLLCPGFRRQPDLLIAASVEDRKNFSTAFDYPFNKIIITGYPRNDIILKNKVKGHGGSAAKRGLYAPTFRGKENSNFDFFEQFGFDVEVMDRFLAELNVTLYLKLHHFNLPTDKIQDAINSADNIFFYQGADVYAEFSSFDFLMTDFSSIYFDFLMLERPIIFAPFDKSGFEGTVRQLYYPYDEVTPGPKAQNWPEVMRRIEAVVHNPDTYSQELQATRKRFHCYADSDSSKRVYDEVISLLSGK